MATLLDAITQVDRETLALVDPDWTSMTQTTLVEHVVYDQRTPRRFEVYPPNDGTGAVVVKCALEPTEVTATTDTIACDLSWKPALLDFILFRAYSKDAEHAKNAELAAQYLAAFMQKVGAKEEASNENTTSRNLQMHKQRPSVE